MITCPHCNSSEFICKGCGSVVELPEPSPGMMTIRPLDLALYQGGLMKDFVFVDKAIFDKVLPYIWSSAVKLLFFFIANLKGDSYHTFEAGHKFRELRDGTGIRNTTTIVEALAQLGQGLPRETKRRGPIQGWNLVKHTNAERKSKFVSGNRWILNEGRVLEGEEYPLFFAGGQGKYLLMHRWIINVLLKELTPDQAVIFLFIYRLTIGMSKEANTITINYFTGKRREVEGYENKPILHQSGLSSHNGVKNVLNQLVEVRIAGQPIILVEDAPDPRYGKIYRLNSNLTAEVPLQTPLASRETIPPSRETIPPSRETTPPSRETIPPSREMTPHDLSSLTKSLSVSDDVGVLNALAQPEIVTNNNNGSSLHAKTEGDKLPKSEKPRPKYSRDMREVILRGFGIASDANIQKALDLLEDHELRTDEDIDEAIAHKKKFPKAKAGVFSNFFTMKTSTLKAWKAEKNPNPSLSSKTDTAPKSPPPSNGAAPHSPALPPDDNAIIWHDTMALLRQQMTQATYSGVIHGAEFVRVEVNPDKNLRVFVIAASKNNVDWLTHRLYDTVLRNLKSVAGADVDIQFVEFTK